MVEELAGGEARGGPSGNEAEELNVTRPNPFSATITWRINWNQAKLKQKCLQSKYVEVGGKDCRLLVYPSGKPGPCAALHFRWTEKLCLCLQWILIFFNCIMAYEGRMQDAD